ncbi:MAG: hypothetical protein K2J20_05655, partial [Bacilli bacterium]|nr:hypothetical protein [Bacilli bacterium]
YIVTDDVILYAKWKIKYYGALVTNYSAGGVNDWRIYHKDEDGRIYLIADDYIEYEQIPNIGEHSLTKGDTDYEAYFNSDVLSDYEGSEWIRGNTNTNARKWLDTYLNSAYGQNNTNANMKAVAYMMDTNIWGKFVDSTYAEYAIGGPTLDLFCASYRKTHNIWAKSGSVNSNGYKVQFGSDSDSYGTSGVESDFEEIYIKSDNSNAEGMWIASPAADVNTSLWATTYNGWLMFSRLSDKNCGFRPIVCLKSEFDLVEDEDGNYSIEDKGKPTLTVEGNTDEWSKSKTLTITATDAESGIKSVTVTVNDSTRTFTDGVATYTAYSNGTYTIVATDNNGNTTTEEIEITKIDNTAPTIIFSKQSNSTESGTQE